MNNIVQGQLPLVSRGFGRYSAARVVAFFQNVIDQTTAVPAFAGIKPTLAEGQAALDDLRQKEMAAANKGKLEIIARKLALFLFLVIARQWANFVEANCNQNLETLRSSGFLAHQAPTTPKSPDTPGNLRVNYTKTPHQLRVLFKGNRNVRNYAVQSGDTAEGPWSDLPLSSSSRVDFDNATPGKMYWFRVQAIGVKGMMSAWSAPTCKIAL